MSTDSNKKNNEALSAQYDPEQVEDRIYKLWEGSGFFNPDKLPAHGGRKPFCITVPPPNVTGSLHMGHALNATIQDILIRKKRMQGYKTLWLPGTDHAGIATQNVVEKELKKQGMTRHDLGREKFIEKVWEWKEKYGNIILNQFKKLGASMDWTRVRFTMDEKYQKAVEEAFLQYNKKNLIFEGKRVINWCVRDHTSLSDLELEYEEMDGTLWYIRYLVDGEKDKFIVVATTRPETMLGDMAVAVNPQDERYKTFVGKKVILPIQNRKIPIIENVRVDKSFGTGAVKVTPAHDALDEQIIFDEPLFDTPLDAQNREQQILTSLDKLNNEIEAHRIIDENGKMNEHAGKEFKGMKIPEARELVVQKLRALNALEKEEKYVHNVAKCYRCGTVIEPLLSKQWFLRMDKLAQLATQAVKEGKVKFHPKQWEGVYLDWLVGVKDWTISRQIWWGHKIPLEGETDVLDTWFSSALWPFATLGWPEKTKDLKEFYPTAVLSTARDIINLWVSRMVFSGMFFMNDVPFHDVLIHPTILTKEGKRMSKSLGTGIDPMTLIEKYGADATRFGLIWQMMGGQDIHWAEEHVVAGKKFCNKIWNAGRFVLGQLTVGNLQFITIPTASTEEDKKILARLKSAKKEVSSLIDTYEFGQALHILYEFFWHEFCDIYIEKSKEQITGSKADGTQQILLYVLGESLKLLHPFMPFITEEIWAKLPIADKKMLIVEQWPLN